MKHFFSLVSLTFVFSFIFLFGNVHAVGLIQYGIEDIINPDLTVHSKITLKFDSPVSHLDYQLGFNIYNFTSRSDFFSADCEVSDLNGNSLVTCDFIGMTNDKNLLTLEFDTDNVIKERGGILQFNGNYGVSLPIERAFTLVTLPENAILAEAVANESFFPPNGKVLTDGRHILVFWEDFNLTSGDNLQFSINYVSPQVRGTNFNSLIAVVTVIVVLVIIAVGLYARRSPKTKEIVTPLMKEDEKVIIDLINKNGGSCIQRVLVKQSDFSKAKVSRLVKSLKERGVVDVEPQGRTTKVTLKLKESESE